MKLCLTIFCISFLCLFNSDAQINASRFNVIGFYSGKNDQAHISFVQEANKWFTKSSTQHNFLYDSTNDWTNLNAVFLKKYQVILFLDSRPESPEQRSAFKAYMDNGGAWMGFHFAGFALTPSQYPQNWDWYHNEFLGSGSYKSNTWRPTPAILRVEKEHPATQNFPVTLKSSPNEWYRWEKDLHQNANIKIILSIDSTSFPAGNRT